MAIPQAAAAAAVYEGGKELARAGIRSAKALATGYGRRSISRLAKEAIFQFPCIFSADIDTDEQSVIAHAYEREFASFVVAAMSLNHDVNRDKYITTGEFLKTLHNNTNVPAAIYNSGNILMESAQIVTEYAAVDPIVLQSLWTCDDNRFDTSCINDMYKPFTRTARQIAERIGMATEAGFGTTDEDEYYDKKNIDEDFQIRQENRKSWEQANRDRAQQRQKDIEHARDRREKQEDYARQRADSESDYQRKRRDQLSDYERQRKDREDERYGKTVNAVHTKKYNSSGTGEFGNVVTDKLNRGKEDFYARHPKAQTAKNVANGYAKASTTAAVYDRNKANQIKQSDSPFATLQPTIIEVGITNFTAGNVWADTLTLGVKAMIRLVPTGQMVSNMCEAAKDRAIFKAIKITEGETKLCDILFGKSKYKNLGIANAKGKWLGALKKRRLIDNIASVTGVGRLTPTTTIVITEAEALEIKNLTGIDFHDKGNVMRLFKKYFLLGFAIYDTDTKILTAIFDGDNDFTQVPFRALVASIKKETDLLSSSSKRF